MDEHTLIIDDNTDYVMLGEIGVQKIALGDEILYTRKSSFCFIELESEYNG